MPSFASRCACLTLALLTAAPAAHAVNLSWMNAAGGNAGTAANWNPAQAPAAGDFLTFALANTYTVTFGNLVPASGELLVTNGSVTFRFPTAHTNSLVLAVPVLGANATNTVESGSLTLQGNLYVGQNAGTSGTFNVTGNGTSVHASGGSGVTMVGDQGTGTLNVLDGATLTVDNSPQTGQRAGGSGTVVVAGVSGTSPFPRSQLLVHNTTTDPFEVGSSGTATVGAIVGGRMVVDGTMMLGRNAAGTGTLTAAGVSSGDSALVEIGGDLKIARNDASGLAAGTGTAFVGSGSIVTVGGTTYTYDPDGGTGQLQVRTGGRFETHGLVMGTPANELDFPDGTLRVTGGTLSTNDQPLTINSLTGTPVFELRDGTQAALASATGPTLEVGHEGAATMRVLSGSDLTVHDFNVVVARESTSVATLELGDAGSTLTVDSLLIVGRDGAGTFRQYGGATSQLHDLRISTQSHAYGVTRVTDAGTAMHVSGQLEVCGTPSGASGADGSYLLDDGAELWLDSPTLTSTIWPQGQFYTYGGSTAHLAGTLNNRGIYYTAGSTMTGGRLQTIAGGRTEGSGAITSSIVALTDTTGSIKYGAPFLSAAKARPAAAAGSGELLLGDPAASLGFHHLGLLQVNDGIVTLQDADSAVVGTVTLAGGTLQGPAGGLSLAPGHRLIGWGTVSGRFRPQGYVIAQTSAGLTFTDDVLATGQGMGGSLIRFAGGSRFLGWGRIDASAQVDAGATVHPWADLTLGGAPALPGKVTVDGTLVVDPNLEVDLNGTDTTRVTGTVEMLGGFLQNAATSPLRIRPNGTLRGTGTLTGQAVVDGTLEPGTGTRRLAFDALNLGPLSHTRFDVGAYSSGQLDTIAVAGFASILGTLELNTLPGYSPAVGDSFLVMSYAARGGSFSQILLNGVPAGTGLQMRYRPNGAYVLIVGLVDAPPVAAPGVLRFAPERSPAPALAFALELPEAADVQVELFDAGGRRVGTLQQGALTAGRHVIREAARPGAAGLYFARATVRGSRGIEVRTARAVRVR